MATSIASVAGAVVATVASSGVVSAETAPNVARPIEPDSVKSGPVSIELDPTFYFRFKVNGDMGPNGIGYEDYMRPIRVAGEVVYCVEPHVSLQGNETVTRAIPLSQGATLRKPGGTYKVSGGTLITAAFINWFMFNASDAQINQVVKSANALNPGEGDQMRNIRNGVRSHFNNDFNKFVFLMQQYYWWGASQGNVDVDWVSGSSPAMTAYWNEMVAGSSAFSINGATGLNGHSKEAAINWMVRLRNLYAKNMSAATYNNDGYILETSGDSQRLFSGASFTPKDTPVTPPVNPPLELPMSLSMQKKSTLSADEIAKSNGEYSLKDAQYGLFSGTDVVGSPTGEVVKEGATPKYTLTTDEQGTAKLSYIESGTWYLKELKAPKGHQLDTRTYKLIVKKGQPEVHWTGEYRVPTQYTTDKPIEKVTQPTPEVGTTLKDDQGLKTVDAKPITLVDTVSYKNLKPGTEYTVSGRLMDKETGKELEPAVTGSTKFTPTEPSGTVDVKFTFDASKLAGKRVVAFEKVSDGEKEVAVHEDINDEDQTVTIKKLNPEIGTTLINKATGDHKASPDKEVTLVDTVKYKNLEVGKEYEVTGRLMDKATGKEFQPAVKATAKFKPTASEGSVDVTFTFDASALAGRSVVAFEVVTLDGQVVATHEDINDAGQTVEFTTPETPKPSEPKPKETPKTKVTPKTGVKGMNYGLVALIGAAVVALGVTSFAIYRKKSHE